MYQLLLTRDWRCLDCRQLLGRFEDSKLFLRYSYAITHHRDGWRIVCTTCRGCGRTNFVWFSEIIPLRIQGIFNQDASWYPAA